MQTRPAEAGDWADVRDIAAASFQSSYALSPQQIETIMADQFERDAMRDRISESDTVVLVAETDEAEAGIGGFVEFTPGDRLTIDWLHVHPDVRGQGIGSALLEAVTGHDDGPLQARVLEDAVEGHDFLNRIGLAEDRNYRTSYGGEDFSIAVFSETGSETGANEPVVDVPETIVVDGSELRVVDDDPIPGRDAPFFPLRSADDDDPIGYVCTSCGSTEVAADGLDRLECSDCGNVHLAEEWDGAYL